MFWLYKSCQQKVVLMWKIATKKIVLQAIILEKTCDFFD